MKANVGCRLTCDHVSAGRHHVRVSIDGYKPMNHKVEVLAGNTESMQVEMELNRRQLEAVTVRSGCAYRSNVPPASLRLDEPLQEIPQNMQIITNKVIADQQITTRSDGFIRHVSGRARLEHWAGISARVTMRGGRAAAFRNGMKVTSSCDALTADMDFVDPIELVKGPAGFMISNGEPAGALCHVWRGHAFDPNIVRAGVSPIERVPY